MADCILFFVGVVGMCSIISRYGIISFDGVGIQV